MNLTSNSREISALLMARRLDYYIFLRQQILSLKRTSLSFAAYVYMHLTMRIYYHPE